jgi:class 3 adenylate cyclase
MTGQPDFTDAHAQLDECERGNVDDDDHVALEDIDRVAPVETSIIGEGTGDRDPVLTHGRSLNNTDHFFPTQAFDSESSAAMACIGVARAVQEAMEDVAKRSGLDSGDLVMRFGLQWGSTLHIGNITSAARFEVTALGDEVNQTAHIEACATGGRTLASKALVERLDDQDAAKLGIDRDSLTYTQLSDLPTATDKARGDAPSIAVCQL